MPLAYLALGDSYTIGEAVPEDGRWPVQLALRLRGCGLDLAPPRIIATTGWTTDELAGAIAAESPGACWDFVTLGIGVNNQYRGRSAAAYRAELVDLLDTATRLAQGRTDRVMMLSIPDWGITPFALREGRDPERIAREIDEFNNVARAVCEAKRIAFVDITPTSRDGGGEAPMLAEDGLHPSAAMYARWVDLALPVAHRVLGETA